MMRGSGAGGLAGKAMGSAMHTQLRARRVAAEIEIEKLRRRAETAGIMAAGTAGRAKRLNVQGVSGDHGGNLYFNSGHRRDGSNFPGRGVGQQQLWARGGIGQQQQQQHDSWNRHQFSFNSGYRRDGSNFLCGGLGQQQQQQHDSWNRHQPQFAVHKQRFRPPLRQQHNQQNLPRHQQRSPYHWPQRFHPPSHIHTMRRTKVWAWRTVGLRAKCRILPGTIADPSERTDTNVRDAEGTDVCPASVARHGGLRGTAQLVESTVISVASTLRREGPSPCSRMPA